MCVSEGNGDENRVTAEFCYFVSTFFYYQQYFFVIHNFFFTEHLILATPLNILYGLRLIENQLLFSWQQRRYILLVMYSHIQ